MSKIQNTSSQRSLATWLTVAANEQNEDWPAPVSLVSVQPVIRWLKDEVARHWSHIVHRPRPHANLPLPCIVRNIWYRVKYYSLKSFYVLQSHPASIPNHKMKFCGSVVWVRWQQIEKYIWWSQSGVHIIRKVQSLGRELIFCMFNNISKRYEDSIQSRLAIYNYNDLVTASGLHEISKTEGCYSQLIICSQGGENDASSAIIERALLLLCQSMVESSA